MLTLLWRATCLRSLLAPPLLVVILPSNLFLTKLLMDFQRDHALWRSQYGTLWLCTYEPDAYCDIIFPRITVCPIFSSFFPICVLVCTHSHHYTALTAASTQQKLQNGRNPPQWINARHDRNKKMEYAKQLRQKFGNVYIAPHLPLCAIDITTSATTEMALFESTRAYCVCRKLAIQC